MDSHVDTQMLSGVDMEKKVENSSVLVTWFITFNSYESKLLQGSLLAWSSLYLLFPPIFVFFLLVSSWAFSSPVAMMYNCKGNGSNFPQCRSQTITL